MAFGEEGLRALDTPGPLLSPPILLDTGDVTIPTPGALPCWATCKTCRC
jgi:hypothetical protein